jgi:hypothetical protein
MLWSALLLVVLTGAAAAAAVVGDAVCFDGYVMDNYCIDRNFLLDAPTLDTLSNPAAHSLHCLVDPGVCYQSGFEMLQDPIGESLVHCRAYELDSTGNAMALALARSLGSPTGCRTCTGDAATGLKKGFRATVHGTVSALTSPPTIAVTGVFQTGTTLAACPGGTAFTVPSGTMCSGGLTTTAAPATGAGATTTAAPATGAGATTTAAPTVGPGVDAGTGGAERASPAGAAASLLLALGMAAVCGF